MGKENASSTNGKHVSSTAIMEISVEVSQKIVFICGTNASVSPGLLSAAQTLY